MQPYGLREQLARIVFWIAILIAIAGLIATLTGAVLIPPPAWIGGALALIGLSVILAGEVIAGGQPRPYTVRGQVVQGEATVRAGLADVSIESGSIDRVASIRHGPLGRPRFSVEDGIAYLKLANPLIPNISQWEAKLALNVLWSIDARSSLGTLSLDLTKLRVERVIAETGMGKIFVKCPIRGFTQIYLGTGMGEIEVILPDSVGARFQIKPGGLGTVQIDNERVQAIDAKRYMTPDFESASTQVEIKIETSAGDIIIR